MPTTLLIVKNQGQPSNWSHYRNGSANALHFSAFRISIEAGEFQIEKINAGKVEKVLWSNVTVRDDSSGTMGTPVTPTSPIDLANILEGLGYPAYGIKPFVGNIFKGKVSYDGAGGVTVTPRVNTLGYNVTFTPDLTNDVLYSNIKNNNDNIEFIYSSEQGSLLNVSGNPNKIYPYVVGNASNGTDTVIYAGVQEFAVDTGVQSFTLGLPFSFTIFLEDFS